jgi:hypothetical protein
LNDFVVAAVAGDVSRLCGFLIIIHGLVPFFFLSFLIVVDGKLENEVAIKEGYRLLSSYTFPAGRIWVITEWDRSVTTFLLPEDY